ncbi:MAG: cobyric acid synthase [Hydrotalea sp.]|nr:cobyric acid synthase [Hydrotalea sp.]
MVKKTKSPRAKAGNINGALMIQGTASSAGKSLIAMGLCRILANRGLRVAPFKPQNMSNNAMVAVDGGEIGRAQALQAMACNLPPSHHFNPVLLKPLGNNLSQLVVQGRVMGNITARDYYAMKPELMKKIFASYKLLQQQYDVIIVEGAGSPAEVNLRADDMANMGFATVAQCPVLLVGDIDRGGVVASVVGTHSVLSRRDRQYIKGFIINKFRGDATLFDDGLKFISKKTGWPALGMVPFFERAHLFPDEDSLSFSAQPADDFPTLAAVFKTPHMAQSDDVAPLRHLLNANGYGLGIIQPGQPLPAGVKIIVLPGSKNTMADLAFLRQHGFDKIILQHHQAGGMVIGLCGGYQMLGASIADPHGVEGVAGTAMDALNLLPLRTILEKEKQVTETTAQETMFGTRVRGYEIHAGVSQQLPGEDVQPLLKINNNHIDGMVRADKKVIGSYLHGLLHNHEFLVKLLAQAGIALKHQPVYNSDLARAMDDWANFLGDYLAIDKIFSLIK